MSQRRKSPNVLRRVLSRTTKEELALKERVLISMAERVGFEPTVERKPYFGFRDRPIQPLWHLSKNLREYTARRSICHAVVKTKLHEMSIE